jgi:hypothetical protein
MGAKSMELPSSGAVDADQKCRVGMGVRTRCLQQQPLGLIHVQMGKQLASRPELFTDDLV